jgi:hypothetical protein
LRVDRHRIRPKIAPRKSTITKSCPAIVASSDSVVISYRLDRKAITANKKIPRPPLYRSRSVPRSSFGPSASEVVVSGKFEGSGSGLGGGGTSADPST